jgi:hypothetical protein
MHKKIVDNITEANVPSSDSVSMSSGGEALLHVKFAAVAESVSV